MVAAYFVVLFMACAIIAGSLAATRIRLLRHRR
ncbi:hypothetical protein SAMN04488564_105469 [Lentzea waywayandensis]|jgi:hypothetical protein|uniref:Uncharacterized protein n=1 Tax=Lentzea waywayandensis TaxID=84724 RepID=A0A1I6EUB0_9PSEU|nr:hypothetical protein SAMN04488564_105469 [Lentzea waywayandensis]